MRRCGPRWRRLRQRADVERVALRRRTQSRSGAEEAPRPRVRGRVRGTTILPAVIAILVVATLGWLMLRDREMRVAISGKVPSDIRAIEAACDDYAADHDGEYPDDLARLVERDIAGRSYLRTTSVPLDPWRRPYLYAPTDEHCRVPRVWTFGRDGAPGGEDDDQDIDNWMLRTDFEAP
jgi:general secretion pathway protein G